MKKSLFIILLTIQLFSCTNQSEKTSEQSKKTDSTTANNQSSNSDSSDVPDNDVQLQFVVAVAEGYNYDSLHKIAIDAGHLLKLKFDTLDRYFNKSRKKIVYPDKYDDEIYAGQYLLRRSGDSIVSIEMRYAYIDTLTDKDENAKTKFNADTLKMFVFANMYDNKKQADSLLRLLKPKFKQANIIPNKMYMGCMH